MKRLVLLGEGQGDVTALPILARRILREKRLDEVYFVDQEVIRAGNAAGLITWDKDKNQPDFSEWHRILQIAARRKPAAVLAIFDGDAKTFPAGSINGFCAVTAAKLMAFTAWEAGAGKLFSLAVVFACMEYESWIIGGAESLAGKTFKDGRPVLSANLNISHAQPETRGKRWLEKNCPGYRPTRDQAPLTELVDLDMVRKKNLRSFARLENAFDQLRQAAESGAFVSTPA